MSDAIDARFTSYATISKAPRVTIGNTVYVWPVGTTREEAQRVIDEAKLIVLTEMRDYHDPGDEDRS